MAVYKDRAGKLWDFDDPDLASHQGMVPASDEDIDAHDSALDEQDANSAADTKGAFGLIGEGFQRGLGHMQDIAKDAGLTPPMPGGDAFGPGGGSMQPPPEQAPPASGADTFPDAFSEEARRRTALHPIWEGIGTGLAAAPAAAVAGAAAGGLGLGVLGPAVAATAARTVTEASAQEYDDAWLEKRPFELQKAVGLTAMFALGDVVLSQGARLVGSGVKKVLGLGERNMVAEAQARASRAMGEGGRATQSVGAASAKEMNEPFDNALGQMTERDAVVLARDADDHLHLAARHSADDLTRLSSGLSESLGNRLKYRDVRIAMDALSPKQIQAQATWVREAVDTALGVSEQIRAGGPSGLSYGNAGKQIASDIEGYARMIMDEPDLAKRFENVDGMKKRLDSQMMALGRDFKADATAKRSLGELLDPLIGGQPLGSGDKDGITKGMLREGLENPKYWGQAGTLQKALNGPWHDMLKHYMRIQSKLLEHVDTKFGVMDASRRVMESDPELWLSVYQKDPRLAARIGKDLGGMFDGYQRLIEARDAHGFVEKEGLPQLAQSIRNMMEDWNLATTVGIAKAKVAHIERDPRKLKKVLDLIEKAPGGIGGMFGAARKVADLAAGDLRIQKGTPLADVWDRGLKRYALHPDLADSSQWAAYSPWMQQALRARGAPIPEPPKGGAGSIFGGAARPPAPAPAAAAAAAGEGGGFGWGKAAGAAAKEHGGKVAGAGLLGLGAEQARNDDPNAPAGASVGPIALGLALITKGGGRLALLDAMKTVQATLEHRGLDSMARHKVIDEMFGGEAKATGNLLSSALSIAENHGVDLKSPNAAKELQGALEDALPGGVLAERVAKVKKETAALGGAVTRAENAAPRIQAARELLGPRFEERLGQKYPDDWVRRDPLGNVIQTFGRYGEDTAAVIKRRLKDPAPMTLDEVRRNVLGIRTARTGGTFDLKTFMNHYTPEEDARVAQHQGFWDAAIGIQHKVRKATDGLDDQFRRVDAEDQAIRETLRDALGMRAPPAAKKPLDLATDATSRYRKAKRGFDDWREKALPPEELKASKTWQTHYYRSINAEARMGARGGKQEAEKMLAEGWLDSDQVRDVQSRATRIGADLLGALNKAVESGRTVPGRVRRGISMPEDEVERLLRAKTVTAQGFMSTSIHDTTPKGFAERRAAEYKEVPVMLEIEQQTGVPLGQGEGELTLRPGTTFDVLDVKRGEDGVVHGYLRESAPSTLTPAQFLQGIAGKIPTEAKIAGGLLAVGWSLGEGEARAAEMSDAPELHEPPAVAPDPEQGPVGMYRDAMRTVTQGGDAVIKQRASAALRSRPPQGRPALRAFTGRRSLDDAVDAARDVLTTYQQNPEALVDRLAESVGELDKTHPSVYMGLVQKAHGIVGYLSQEAPQRVGKTLLDPEGAAPSADRSMDFAYKTVGALMPQQAMSDIARLDAAPEELASFQQNWPELWEPLRAELLGQVQRRFEAGRPVDGEKLRQLDTLLQMDGQLDPSGSTAVAQQMLAAQEQTPPPPAQSAPPSGGKASGKMASSFRTRLEGAQMENQIG